MNVDLSGLMHGLVALLAALLSAAAPYLVVAVERWLRIKQTDQVQALNTAAQATVNAAVQRAAGIAYAAIAAAPKGYTDPVVTNNALAAGLNHVVTSIPDALALLGVTQATVISMVQGELGKLLAVDPNVSAGGTVVPAPTPAPTAAPLAWTPPATPALATGA